VKEFGTGNKEHQQIIEQCEAFLNAYGLSRFAPLPYDPASCQSATLPDTASARAAMMMRRWCSTRSRNV
jgi:hypothetical protein